MTPVGLGRVDVLVVGAGPAGCAAALAAAARGARVLLVGALPGRPTGRLELIDGRAREDLVRLGILDVVAGTGTPCAGRVVRWGGAGFQETSSLLDPYGGGWIVDRAAFDGALLAVVRESGIAVRPDRVRRLEPVPGGWHADLPGGGVHAARVVVATGRGLLPALPLATARRPAGPPTIAISRWARPGLDGLGDRLLVDGAGHGWWFALGHPTGTRVTYVTRSAQLPSGRGRVEHVWRTAAGAASWVPGRLDRPVTCDATGRMIGTEALGLPGLQVVGDAALAVDPLSGHGVSLALRGAWLAEHDPRAYATWLAEMTDGHERERASLEGALATPADVAG